MNERSFTVTSEDDFLKLLNVIAEDPNQIDGWAQAEIDWAWKPGIEIRFVGENFNSSLTSSSMKALLEFQKTIFQIYAQTHYGTNNTSRLTRYEREALEIKATITPGSTIAQIDIFNLAEKVLPNMTGQEQLILILGLAGIFSAKSLISLAIQKRADIRMTQTNNESERAHLEDRQRMSEQETRRAERNAESFERIAELSFVNSQREDHLDRVIPNLKQIPETQIEGVSLDQETSNSLSQVKPDDVPVRLEGNFRIDRVNHKNQENVKLRVTYIKTGEEFTAEIPKNNMGIEIKDSLKNQEWTEDRIVNATIMAHRIDGVITKAWFYTVEGREIQ